MFQTVLLIHENTVWDEVFRLEDMKTGVLKGHSGSGGDCSSLEIQAQPRSQPGHSLPRTLTAEEE